MKKFTYSGKDYLKRDYTEIYTRVSRFIRIDYTAHGEPFFRFRGRRYHLGDFMRVEDFTEISASDGEKIALSGYQTDVYYKPYFIEIDDGGEAVRVYQYEGTEEGSAEA